MENRTSANPPTKTSAAIIGCGGIGYRYGCGETTTKTLSHFHSIQASPLFELVGIADPDPVVRAEISGRFAVPAYENAEGLMENLRPEVVIVSTPEETHAGILDKLLCARPRFVFCEKPLACMFDDVVRIVEAYKSRNIGLEVNYTRRFLQPFEKVGRGIRSGAFGRIQSVAFYYSRGLLHNACHYLDLSLWWFGEPDRIIVEGRREGMTGNDPTLSVFMGYPSGLDVHLIGLESSGLLINEIDVIGSRKRFRIDTMGKLTLFEPTLLKDYGPFQCYAPVEEELIDPCAALPNALSHIHQWLEGGVEPRSSGEESIRLHRLIQKIIERAL